ncbi:MAG TPA: DUF4124 domain-containing protein [Woeseiaceae bacterium]|nr:DUF4124 domain-containing protein [Woeseiaceae bacterium]
MKRDHYRRQILAIAATAAVLGTSYCSASEIYRYTDAEGEVHYVDRPSGVPGEEVMAISSRPSTPSQTQARSRNSSSGQDTVEEPQPETMTRAQRAAHAKQQELQCQKLRDQLESYMNSRRLYREDEAGEREYLDDAEIDEARNKVAEQIAQTCK